MKDKSISHIGRVVEITGGKIKVSINSESACSGCHAKGKCGLAESKEKIVDVEASEYPDVSVGDEVDVVISMSDGILAVVLAYIVPVFMVVIALWLGEMAGLSEIVSFIVMLAVVAIYYLILYKVRRRFEKKMNIRINQK